MKQMKQLTTEEVGKMVLKYGLGDAVDTVLEPAEVEDKTLGGLIKDCQTAMNEIQMELECKLGVDFFDVDPFEVVPEE
jgi:hypothetical protein